MAAIRLRDVPARVPGVPPVPVAPRAGRAFRPSRSQQRAWKANHRDVSLVIGRPTVSDAHRSLYERFHRHQSREKGWRGPEANGVEAFLDNPFATEEWRYTPDGRLIGVGYVDRLPQALSAIYFYYDPDERARSLGTYNVLSIIERARTLGVPNVYLGTTSKAAALSPTRPPSSPTKCLPGTARGSRSGRVERKGPTPRLVSCREPHDRQELAFAAVSCLPPLRRRSRAISGPARWR